jgi:hypothetical protein
MEFFADAPKDFAILSTKFARSAFHMRRGVRDQWTAMSDRRARALWAATLPAGWLAYRLERLGLAEQVRRIRLLLE